MQPPLVPDNEKARLAALDALDILDTPPEERYDRFTRIAQRVFATPIALVSLVDANRQWLKSRQGLEATETERCISFCGHAAASESALVVPDALEDPRFRNNPLVVESPAIRFYVGAPLRVPTGEVVGTLCVFDQRPRDFSVEDLALLNDLARAVELDLAARALASTDELTGLTSRHGLRAIAAHVLARARRDAHGVTVLYFDLDGFKRINDTLGHTPRVTRRCGHSPGCCSSPIASPTSWPASGATNSVS